MKPGISQLILSKIPTREFIDQAAEAEYEIVELAVRKEGDLTPQTPESARRDIVDQATDKGLEIASVVLSNRSGNLLAGGDDGRTAVDETVEGLEVAASVGARVALHTLGALKPDLFYEDAYANAVTALKELAAHCERTGVDIAVEFVWNGFLFSPLEMRRFLDEVGSPHIGFYFDPGNMAVFQPPPHWVRATGKHIKMVHMKDWRGRALNGGWTALGQGEVDFAAVMRELRAAGYDDALISEVDTGLAPIADTCRAIREIMTI